MDTRRTMVVTKSDVANPDDAWDFEAQVIAPIVAEGDPIGVVVLATKDVDTQMGDLEIKLAETAAGFLAKQMEQ